MENEMTEKEINNVVKRELGLFSPINNIVIILLIIIGVIYTGYSFYKQGCEDTKKIYKEPQIHVTLVPEYGMVTVIPVKLTDKGVAINFGTIVTNLKAIGLDMPNVKK